MPGEEQDASPLPLAAERGPGKPGRTRGTAAESALIRRRFASTPSPADGRRGAPLAIGVGFRRRCTGETLAAIIREALARLAATDPAAVATPAVLATIAAKDRPPLREAAARLGLEVIILPKSALLGMEDRVTVASERVRACLGIPSVAEAAALAATGPGSRLVVARIATADATCAIAAGPVPEIP